MTDTDTNIQTFVARTWYGSYGDDSDYRVHNITITTKDRPMFQTDIAQDRYHRPPHAPTATAADEPKFAERSQMTLSRFGMGVQ